jgi:hypothetical protein
MTWAKYGAEYNDELANAGVSDAAYRTHSEGIAWLYLIEASRLRIPKNLVRRFAGSPDYELAIKELVDIGYWRDRNDAWEIIHHAGVIRQSIEAQKQLRERNKRAQKAHRTRTAKPPPVSGDVSADISDAVSDSSDRQTDLSISTIRRPKNTSRTARKPGTQP